MDSTVEDLHRHHASLLGDVASDHQYHPEFTDCVRKPQNRPGNKAGFCQRQNDVEERVPRAGPQRCGDFQWARAYG